jgi:hypothetical protein
MKINCLSCGFGVLLDEAYDEYEGQVKCYVCGNLLEIKAMDGRLQSVRVCPAGNMSIYVFENQPQLSTSNE